MKKEVAKKWVKALRSGKYKKGTGYLKQYNKKNEARYCCLGVLCELYNGSMKKNHKKTLKTRNQEHDFDYNNGVILFNNKYGSLPNVVKKWAGMKDSTGEFLYKIKDKYGEYKNNENLSVLNDTGRKFSTIANTIEKHIEDI
jgi:hypothetical protein